MEIKEFTLVEPTEENHNRVFSPHLEEDDNVFFHMTPISSKEPIISNGFLSAKDLGTGILESVSYAKKSSSCFSNLGCQLISEHVIFVVRFNSEKLKEVVNNLDDIFVYKKNLQPEILGVLHLPNGFEIT